MLGLHPISDAPVSSLANILQVIQAIAIASAGNFGTPKLNLKIYPTGVASGESVQSPRLNLRLYPGSFSDNEFGTSKINRTIKTTGITSSEAFGQANIASLIQAIGIISAEAYGIPTLNLRIKTSSFGGEVFGAAQVLPGAVYITPEGIASASEFGVAIITFGTRMIVYPQGGLKIISGKNVKKPTFISGTVSKPVYGNRKPFTPKYKPPC